MNLPDAVATLDLPDHHAVNKLLKEAGVTGRRNECTTCPIAVYLTQLTGRPVGVGAVGAAHAASEQEFERESLQQGRAAMRGEPTTSTYVLLPYAARQFITYFDSGRRFQGLVA